MNSVLKITCNVLRTRVRQNRELRRRSLGLDNHQTKNISQHLKFFSTTLQHFPLVQRISYVFRSTYHWRHCRHLGNERGEILQSLLPASSPLPVLVGPLRACHSQCGHSPTGTRMPQVRSSLVVLVGRFRTLSLRKYRMPSALLKHVSRSCVCVPVAKAVVLPGVLPFQTLFETTPLSQLMNQVFAHFVHLESFAVCFH